MSATIKEFTETTFEVSLDGSGGGAILVTVTSAGDDVEAWLADVLRFHDRHLGRLVVGFDVEWRPNIGRFQDNPVALLQLCVGRRCRLFHILHADRIPGALADFLGDRRFRFVGVGVEGDVERLVGDWELSVANPVKLGVLAAEGLGRAELRQAGLKGLARAVIGGLEVEKPKRVTMSRWDNPWLTWDQIKYATVDAFLSFEIGRRLLLLPPSAAAASSSSEPVSTAEQI